MSLGILVGVLLTGTALWLFLAHSAPKPYFTDNELAAVSFPVYAPTTLPEGYKVDADSGSLAKDQSGVLILTASNKAGQKIYLSQQARLSTFDYGGFYKNLTDSKTKSVPVGEIAFGYTSTARQTAIASLVTQKSWVIANSNAASPVELARVLENLNKTD